MDGSTKAHPPKRHHACPTRSLTDPRAAPEPILNSGNDFALSPDAQVGLRLPKDVVGIDIDMYDTKAGRRTVAVLQTKWGKLPRTWMSSSRRCGSGIRLFLVPPGFSADNFRDPLGTFGDGSPFGGVEVVRYCHRFVTVFPSHHGRDGRPMYQWFDPDGFAADDRVFPQPADAALLPEGWAVGLATGRPYNRTRSPLSAQSSPADWLKARPGGDGPLCRAMRRDLAAAVEEVTARGVDGGCYPAFNEWAFRLVGNAAEGCRGGYPALVALSTAYLDAMAARPRGNGRSAEVARGEIHRSLVGAIERLPESKLRDEDLCALDLSNWGK